jgi:hypothetical protein
MSKSTKSTVENTAPATPAVSEIEQAKAKLAELKAAEVQAKEEAKAAREKLKAEKAEADEKLKAEAAEKAELRKEIELELADKDEEIKAARETLDKLKAERAEITAKLPKGVRGVGERRTVKDPTKLLTAHVRILKALAEVKGKGVLTRQLISEQTGVPESHVVGFTGDVEYKNKPYPTLVKRGFAEEVSVKSEDGGREQKCWRITPAGRDALKTYLKTEAAKE